MITKEKAIELALEKHGEKPLEVLEPYLEEMTVKRVNELIDFYNKRKEQKVKKLESAGPVKLWAVPLVCESPKHGGEQELKYFLDAKTGRFLFILWEIGR